MIFEKFAPFHKENAAFEKELKPNKSQAFFTEEISGSGPDARTETLDLDSIWANKSWKLGLP